MLGAIKSDGFADGAVDGPGDIEVGCRLGTSD